ncbi:hypothetical protein WICPIJ_002132 [Wickerhamomyces pijperi]|uniref:Uncharacterized protein n=1 Tax=Wickerhamomyces pijperi TaxID=599730 RepID=A0A9P8TQH1_WICPI|nr:hypothetical protein WICPIJ_002132 [Wickerhamomyces pijperi]
MAFNSFLKHTPFYNISSKRYHTAAKSTTSFFDSTFNHIRQNNQLQNTPIINFESVFAKGSKRRDHPLHSLSIGPNYIAYDNQNQQQQSLDETEKTGAVSDKSRSDSDYILKNPINIVLPFDQEHIILSIYKNRNGKSINLTPGVDVSQAIHSTNSKKLPTAPAKAQQQQQQRKHLHTAAVFASHEISLPKEGEPKFFQALYEDSPVEQSDETMKLKLSSQIEQAFKAGNYQRINSLYMALKRNNIAPSREVYRLVLLSIVRRNIDTSLDDQNFQLMTVYQDVLSNRIKPDLEMYSLVLKQLLESSINATINPALSANGEDFFRIAIDIFNASNTSSFQKFSPDLLDLILIGMNIYPGLINQEILVSLFNNQTFTKTPIYFMSMIAYSKHTNNLQLSLALYEEFKALTVTTPALQEHQFEIYSCLISTLLHLRETQQATKFLDKLLGSIKSHPDYEAKITTLLDSYLIPLSVSNPEKAFEIWSKFNKIEWIPEFSAAFYERMLANSLSNYQIASFYYNYMIALPVCSKTPKFESILFTPFSNKGFRDAVITNFTALAIQQGDKPQLLKIIKHSMISGVCFSNFEIYGAINSVFQSNDLMISLANRHGLNQGNPFAFLEYLVSTNLISNPVQLISTEFFKRLVDEFGILKEGEPFNYSSFYTVLYKVFNLVQTTPGVVSDAQLANILSPLVVEFYDLENYYYTLRSQNSLEFKEELLKFFSALNINPEQQAGLSKTTEEAMKLVEGLQRE